MSSFQTVFFDSPSVIQQMQAQIAALSTYNSITTTTANLQSNTYNIWQLPAINGYTGVAATLTFPANPSNGDFIYIKDGLGTWGNQLYNAPNPNASTGALGPGPLLNFNGKTAKDACSDGVLLNYRQGAVSFTFNASTNQWEGNSDLDLSKNSIFPGNNPDDPWTGWWTNITRNFSTTFVGTPATDSQGLPFLYIDNTVYPANITVYKGSTKYPDTFGVTTLRTFEQTGTQLVRIDSLVGSRTIYPIGSNNSSSAFILQNDKTLMTYSEDLATGSYGSLTTFGSDQFNSSGFIFKKLSTSPFNQSPNVSSMRAYDETEILSNFVSNPVEMAKNIFYQHFVENAPDCMAGSVGVPNPPYTYAGQGSIYRNKPETIFNTNGWYAIEEELNNWINVGKTFTTPIIAVGKSASGSSGIFSFGIQPGSTLLTDIYCGECPYTFMGSNVTIAGCSGSWSGLNGYYPNGISLWESTTLRKDIDSGLYDYKKLGPGQFTGTTAYVLNRFLLNKDTYNDNTTTYIAYTGGLNAGRGVDFNILGATPTISVTHRFTPTMTFNEFVAAIMAFFWYVYGSCSHNNVAINYIPTSTYKQGLIPTEWNKLGNISTNSQVGFSPLQVFRPGNASTPVALNVRNSLIASSNGNTNAGNTNLYSFNYRNDPYKTESYLRSKFCTGAYLYIGYTGALTYNSTLSTGPSNFNPLVLNYVTGARFSVIGWGGSGTNGPIETDPLYNKTSQLYSLMNTDYPGTSGGSMFQVKLFPVETIATGSGGPSVLDANYWMMGNIALPSSISERIKVINRDKCSQLYGFIKPVATSGQTVGYIKITRSGYAVDVNRYMSYPIYGPKGSKYANVANYFKQSFSYYWSKVMEYIVRDGGATAIIIDNRSNPGGGRTLTELGEFFGGDRGGWKFYMSRKGDGFGDLIDTNSYNFGAGYKEVRDSTNMYNVSSNRSLYPGCVFSGTGVGTSNAKKVIMLSTDGSLSAGSTPQLHFLGDKWDKNIGSNTFVKYVGSSDPKWSDTSGNGNVDPPLSAVSKKILYSNSNTQYPYIQMAAAAGRGNIGIAVTGPYNTGAFWTNSIIPQQYMDTLTYTGAWKGTAGGNSLPSDYASTVWQDFGLLNAPSWTYTGYDGYQYINDGRSQPDPNDWTTWRDRWLETSIREAISGIF